MRGMLGAAWGRAIPMRRATLIALLTAERAQLDCLRLPGAYCLLAGRSTRQANAKSHGDRPAPAESRPMRRAVLSALLMAERAQHGCPHPPSARRLFAVALRATGRRVIR